MDGWKPVCALDEIPLLGSRVVKAGAERIALFRTAQDDVFALFDRCPHKGGPLSQGMVAGKTVTCPLHGWKINLDTGAAVAPDQGCARRLAARVEAGVVWLQLA